jgi:hypothetical protein
MPKGGSGPPRWSGPAGARAPRDALARARAADRLFLDGRREPVDLAALARDVSARLDRVDVLDSPLWTEVVPPMSCGGWWPILFPTRYATRVPGCGSPCRGRGSVGCGHGDRRQARHPGGRAGPRLRTVRRTVASCKATAGPVPSQRRTPSAASTRLRRVGGPPADRGERARPGRGGSARAWQTKTRNSSGCRLGQRYLGVPSSVYEGHTIYMKPWQDFDVAISTLPGATY